MSGQWGLPQQTPQHHQPTPKPWYKKKRWVIPLGLFVTVAIIGQFGDKQSGPDTVQPLTAAATETSDAEAATTTDSEAVTEAATKSSRPKTEKTSTATKKATSTKPAKDTAKAKKVAPRTTTKASKPKPKKTTAKPRPKKPSGNCDPNYSDACVPVASDVDCAGGRGNGPAYFAGIARVTGTDVYQLDRDNDGFACEPN